MASRPTRLAGIRVSRPASAAETSPAGPGTVARQVDDVLGIAFGIIAILLVLLIPISLVWAVAAQGRRREEGGDPGIGTVRRLYYYGLALAGLIAAGIGGVLLLRTILEALFGTKALLLGSSTLALGLALTMVGTPIWLLFWGLAQRSVSREGGAVEAGAASRKFYLYLVLGGSAVTSSISAIMFLRWLFGVGDFRGTPLSSALVWGGIWGFHWLVEGREGQPNELARSIRKAYVYSLALFGLVVLTVGTGYVMRSVLSGAYHELFGAPNLLTSGVSLLWNTVTQTTLAMALVGLGVWWWHWHRVAGGDFDSTLRQVYLYLFGILAGAATAVVSFTVLLYHLLQWFFGRPETSSALLHFDIVPGVIAAATVGSGMWGYHRAVVRDGAAATSRSPLPEAQEKAQAGHRVYGYLVSAVGLVTLGVGLVILSATAIGLVTPNPGLPLTGNDWWRNPLVLSITLLLVGLPVWGLYWRDIQRVVALAGQNERSRLPRRIFIFLIFGLSILLTLVNLSIALFRVFDAALGKGVHAKLVWDIRWSIAILLTAGAASVYYWLVLQEDRKATAAADLKPSPTERAGLDTLAAPPRPRPRKSVLMLVSEDELPLVRRLEDRLGYQIQVWRRVGQTPISWDVSEEELAEVERKVIDAISDHVLLLKAGRVIRVIPYQNSPG